MIKTKMWFFIVLINSALIKGAVPVEVAAPKSAGQPKPPSTKSYSLQFPGHHYSPPTPPRSPERVNSCPGLKTPNKSSNKK